MGDLLGEDLGSRGHPIMILSREKIQFEEEEQY
jgi:hypothetical protein